MADEDEDEDFCARLDVASDDGAEADEDDEEEDDEEDELALAEGAGIEESKSSSVCGSGAVGVDSQS